MTTPIRMISFRTGPLAGFSFSPNVTVREAVALAAALVAPDLCASRNLADVARLANAPVKA